MTSLSRIGLALLTACFAPALARAAVPLPTGGTLSHVDFERHVMGLLSKTGCNSGSCHGSFQGKNGFRLSLFGYEPSMDHAALTRDNLGRRIDQVNPDNSLVLTKAIGSVAHDGGMRFGKDAWTYNVFREWIRGGAKWTPGSGTVAKLTVAPGEFALIPAARTLQVKVTATFADGSTEDVTPFCDFKVNDDAIATVSPLGQVTAVRTGDAGLMVQYRGTVAALRVLVPAPALKGGYPPVPVVNYIDREVFAKLQMLNMVPSDLASDAQFLRRVTIDTIGQLPTPDEIRAFLADKSPDKRTKKIDQLLVHPLHAALWATKLSDITGNTTEALERPIAAQSRRSQMWHDWLRKRVQDNVPYDQLARAILTATSRDDMTPEQYMEFVKRIDAKMDPSGGADGGRMARGTGLDSDYANKKSLDYFWRRQQQVPIEQWGEKVAAAFMGVRLECAQCHKHPFDRWTQEEYWSFANVFSEVNNSIRQYSSRELKALADKENAIRTEKYTGMNNNNLNLVREMFVSAAPGKVRAKPNPTTKMVPTPQAPGGPKLPHVQGKDTRVALADWLTAKENPFFARSFVNRVWAHYFGIGVVNPVDDFSVANPPTNPRLLNALAKDFAESGFDLRRLERNILLSRTYQLSYDDNDSNKFDKNNYSHAFIRPLMAEQVVDVLNSALAVEEKFAQDETPIGKKMLELGSSRITNPNVAYALRIFGRPPRTTACDCERASEPALPQSLFRMTDQAIVAKFNDPKGRVQQIIRSKATPEAQVDELFLATLSRYPNPKEKSEAVVHLASAGSDLRVRIDAMTDLLWALINTREFILNH